MKISYTLIGAALALVTASAAQAQFRNPANTVASQFTLLNPSLTPQYITREGGNNLDQIQFLPVGSSSPTHMIACIEVTLACLSGACADPFVFGDKLTPSVQRINLSTGAVETVVRGMTICDGIRTTPWGTVIATEEDFVGDVGAAYEILDPMTTDQFTVLDRKGGGQAAVIVDQTGADASDRIAKRTALPVIRYEGLYVDETGVILAGDEERPGSYAPGDTDGGALFKFIPSTLRLPGAGNITALSQSPLVAGTNYALQVSCINNNQQFGQGCEIGNGRWVVLPAVPAAVGEDVGIARIGRESADQIGATGYYRPEDLHDDPSYSDPLNPNAVRFCFANTGDRTASNFGEVQCAIDQNITAALATRQVVINRFVEGNGTLNQPDNLAFQPGSNVLYVIEDNPNGDVWACLPDGVDTDIKSDGCVKVFTLADASAEPTGFIFTPDGSTAIFNIQHSNDNLMPLFDGFSTDDVVKLTGFGAITPTDFGQRTETLLNRSSQQLFGLKPLP